MKRVRRRAAAPEATTTPLPDAAPQISGEAPIGEGATVAGVTAAPKEGSNPSASATRASRLPKAPSGPIQTLAPGGGSFGIDWSAINPYDELVAQACDAFRVPFGRLKAVIPIESRGDRHAVQKNDRNGWSYGLVQVVPYGNGWDRAAAIAKIAGLGSNYTREQVITALYDPAINLRVGASILADFYATHQDWDAANSSFFIGKPGWGSGDTVNGTTGQQYKQSLDGLLAEIWAADRQTARGEGSHTFGMPAWPKGFDRRILKKPPSGNGWDALGSRSAGMAGAAVHCTDGYDNRDAIWQLFSIGGARAYDAATDAVIDRAGLGYLLLDPWSVDPLEGSGMTPWASGGNQATVQLQWNTADEGTNFGRSNCALHTYNGTDWVAGALGAAGTAGATAGPAGFAAARRTEAAVRGKGDGDAATGRRAATGRGRRPTRRPRAHRAGRCLCQGARCRPEARRPPRRREQAQGRTAPAMGRAAQAARA